LFIWWKNYNSTITVGFDLEPLPSPPIDQAEIAQEMLKGQQA
jgi:hypothetical protein